MSVKESLAATSTFAELFGRDPEVRADAPGRVNLIGEQTDFSGGYVLPVAIPQRTRVELTSRVGPLVRVWSAGVPEPEILEYRLGDEAPVHSWLDYVQGVTEVLRQSGYTLRGFDLWIESDLPMGGGLAASAALQVSLLRALREAFGLDLDDVQVALAAQKAENDFVGTPAGVMDAMASSLDDERSALFLDTRSLQYETILLPVEAELVVIDSGISPRRFGREHRLRRQECEQAAEQLGVRQLRDLAPQDLWRLPSLPEPLDRRARHVITENARVRSAVASLRERDLPRLGKLFAASHESLRNDFEVSIPEIDELVELASGEPDVFGAHLTGGGFGGAIVAVARRGTGRQAGERIAARYGKGGKREATVLVPAP